MAIFAILEEEPVCASRLQTDRPGLRLLEPIGKYSISIATEDYIAATGIDTVCIRPEGPDGKVIDAVAVDISGIADR